MKIIIKILCIIFVFVATQSLSDTFKSKHAEAIKDYNNGDIVLAFKKLKSLVKKGDSESARLIGILLIKGKFGNDIDKAFDWFEVSAKMCNPLSLEFLKSKYLERGGIYFKPTRLEYIKSKCESYKIKNKKLVKKYKEKKLVEKPKKKKLSEKKYSENIDKKNQDFNFVINKNVRNSWKKIRPRKDNLKFLGSGSGFAISQNGHFLTNDHVIKKCGKIHVYYNNMMGTAKLLITNSQMDSAILKVDAITPYHLDFNDKPHKLGEDLYAAGYPFTTDLIFKKAAKNMTLSKGILANTEMIKSNLLLISVPIASGNSGGPVLGKYGLIRGQITAGFDVEKLIKKSLGKNSGKILATNITMNLMISSIKLKNWINNTNIIYKNNGKRNIKFDSDEIGEIATHTVAAIECYN